MSGIAGIIELEKRSMLAELLGSKSAERILLFLLVNERCFATQLHRLFAVPLTPLQKGLERLERAGVVASHLEGKRRLYRFDPTYPLLEELESLLKRAYSTLSPHEKKEYYYVPHSSLKGGKSEKELLLAVWDRLKEVEHVTFEAKSHSKKGQGWKGRGKGDVVVTDDGDATLIFHEEGVRVVEGEQEFNFSNVFRWQLHRIDGLLSLEHLRFGPQHPVFMFHLQVTGKNSLESVHSHLCKEDTYFGALHLETTSLRLTWRIIGPKKNEELEYRYF